jgi:hypothetical protein
MGMFDWVKCEVPLPDGFVSDNFQTKDFENLLYQYTITKEGKLTRTGSGDWLDPEDDVELSVEIVPFHGIFEFYDYEHNKDVNDKNFKFVWHEYEAKFTDGNLVSITKMQKRGLDKAV